MVVIYKRTNRDLRSFQQQKVVKLDAIKIYFPWGVSRSLSVAWRELLKTTFEENHIVIRFQAAKELTYSL